MGPHAPWLSKVRETLKTIPWRTEVKVNVTDMAQLMADSDLVISAAGSTVWECSCLGLPSFLLVLAENQRGIAKALEKEGAAYIADCEVDAAAFICKCFDRIRDMSRLNSMSQSGSHITNGHGAKFVTEYIHWNDNEL